MTLSCSLDSGWISSFLNIFFILQDLLGAIKRVSSFLHCPLVEEELNNCVKHCSFSSMKDNKMINYTLIAEEIMDHSKGSFMRKGEALLYTVKLLDLLKVF